MGGAGIQISIKSQQYLKELIYYKTMVKLNYTWRRIDDHSRNLCAYEIQRANDKLPYTILIFNYTTIGDKQLFSDLFYASSWDERRGLDNEVSDDVKFCMSLWRELGLYDRYGEDFQPKHIEHDLDRVPQVYRKSIEQVFAKRFGTGEVETCECCASYNCKREESQPIVIPLNLDIHDTDEEVANKIIESMEYSFN